MNILVLTPDGVGSTILQRLLTLKLYLEKIPVQNTHELTNGLFIKNRVAQKNFDLKYTQKLDQIIDILKQSSEQTKLVSRLAKYHLDNREDSLHDQKNFISFINNFYNKKIMCIRQNIFEYALSWSIRRRANVLNIYFKKDKEIVNSVKEVDENFFLRKCQEYVNYVNWVETNFSNVEKVSYEELIQNTDNVLDNIVPHKDTFKKHFSVELSSILKIEHKYINPLFLGKKIDNISKKEIQTLVRYKLLCNDLVKKGILLPVPLKNTLLEEKQKQIINFDKCLDIFYSFAKNHNWIDQSLATYDFWTKKYIC